MKRRPSYLCNKNMMSNIIPLSVSIRAGSPHLLDDLRESLGSRGQFTIAQPYQANVATQAWLRQGKNGQVFAEEPRDGSRRNDRNANPGAHEAHHGGELSHRRDMLKRRSEDVV